ncbi:LAMI_0H02674g1_1 [Lachancea mirantina]|uniref:LAMI_0H02674g1_1 n=1 Tax=Lachancea mirantina TaxID=1230905 RepID=A0A1G4KE18_9SACH|nr:LAMI_0H02674g1_1 [Lachancea mirantina]
MATSPPTRVCPEKVQVPEPDSVVSGALGHNGDQHDSQQVLFMEPRDTLSRSNHVPPTYYQVATPKSPHEFSSLDEDEERPHIGDETERLKYIQAKREIMDALNLHILVNKKESDEIERELRRVDAQMQLMRQMHADQDLLAKVDAYQEQEFQKRQELLAFRRYTDTSHPFDDTTLSGSFSRPPLSTSGSTAYYYHTRSKSSGNVGTHNEARLRPANDGIIKMRVSGAKYVPGSAQGLPGGDLSRPPPMNQSSRRNYGSSSFSSISGVVGRNEKDEAIFRRPDGVLIVIACSYCERSGFSSAQGIVNHVRLKHAKTYSSQPLAILNNQQLLPEEQQPREVLTKFRELNLDPQKEYLPHVSGSSSGGSLSGPSGRKNSSRELSPKGISPLHSLPQQRAQKSTKHLEKLYTDSDFEEIVKYVNDAQKDLDAILKSSPEHEDSDEPDGKQQQQSFNSENDEQCQSPPFTAASAIPAASAASTGAEDHKKPLNKKRERSPDFEVKKKQRPAEKRVRPDAIAMMNIPDEEKRSSHYNLRAKSKLRSHNRYQ